MKKYVFIAPTLANMGGAQMYIRNKLLYLRQKDWVVSIIRAEGGFAQLSELQEFDVIVPELAFDIFCFSKRKRKKIVNFISNTIDANSFDEVIIESTCISEGSWAEAVASKIGAKHLLFLLQENNFVDNKGMRDFFTFKHQRKELVGISETSLLQLFEHFNPITPDISYSLPAYCNNVEADIDHPLLHTVEKKKYDAIVGCLSRLDKPFIIPSIGDFCKYANNNNEKRFLLLMIGGAPKGSGIEDKIITLVKTETSNVEIMVLGYLYPVPTKLLELCDVFFSSAGSAIVCMRSGAPTIVYDGNDYKPIGILGRTTNSLLFRDENEPPLNFSMLMEQILTKKRFIKEQPSFQDGLPDFSTHLEYLSTTKQEKKYFDVESIRPDSILDYKLKIALALIGANNYLKLGFLKQKWFGNIDEK